MNKLFENPGSTIKKLSVIAFYVILVAGIIMLLVGYGHMNEVHEYAGNSFSDLFSSTSIDALSSWWRADAYTAKMEMIYGLFAMVASLSAIPLYGFGCIIEDVASIKNSISANN